METTLHRHHLFVCQPLVRIKIPFIHKHGAGGVGSDFDMRYLKFPPITATHISNSSRFLCVNNKITPSNIRSGCESESSSTTTSDIVVKEKEKTEEQRPIPEPPEKPLPGDCCGSGCVRCVWDIYYQELEEYNNLYKSKPASDSLSNLKPSV